jgi:hypothetical protein
MPAQIVGDLPVGRNRGLEVHGNAEWARHCLKSMYNIHYRSPTQGLQLRTGQAGNGGWVGQIGDHISERKRSGPPSPLTPLRRDNFSLKYSRKLVDHQI